MLISLKYEHWVLPASKADPRFKVLLDKIGFRWMNDFSKTYCN